MEKFINDHPIITFLSICTICNSIVRIIRPDALRTIVTTKTTRPVVGTDEVKSVDPNE